MSENQNLSRGLKNRHVQLLAIGGAIGTGLFLGSGRSIHLAGPSILFAYAITGLICFLIMRALGELLLSNLNYHSFVEFVHDYLGNGAAFITGWTYWFCWISLAMADLTASGLYMQYWFPGVPQWLPSLIFLVVLLGMNLTAVKLFGEMEFWFALIKIVAILLLIIVGVFMIIKGFSTNAGASSFANLWKHGGWFPNGSGGFILSFQMVVFAFTGIELVGLTAGETENPKHVIPRAINNIPIRIIIFYI
ncbi:amino acid permease, partial [Clostridium tyrobutyricum]